MPRDAVCGMLVQEPEAVAQGLFTRFGEQTYCFCSEQCKRRFDAEPAQYASHAAVHPDVPYGQGGRTAAAEPGRPYHASGQPEMPQERL